MPNIGPLELILLGVLAILIFGPAKLPEIGRSIGRGMREFKDSVSGMTDVKDTLDAVGEVRSAVSPTNLAGTFIPGVKDVQETVSAAKGVAAPAAAAAVPAAAIDTAEGAAGTTPPPSA
jgi:sec-independent protein translocase protein TatA